MRGPPGTMEFRPIRQLSGILLLLALLALHPASVSHAAPLLPASKGNGAPTTPEPAKEPPTEQGIPDLQSLNVQLSKQSIDLESALNASIDPSLILDGLPPIREELRRLQKDIALSRTAEDLNGDTCEVFALQLDKLQRHLTKVSAPGREALQQMIQQHLDWSAQEKIIADAAARMQQLDAEILIKNDVAKAKQRIDASLAAIQARMTPMKRVIDQVDEIQVTIYAEQVKLQKILEEYHRDSLQQTNPPIFSAKFLRSLNTTTLRQSWDLSLLATKQQGDVGRQNLLFLFVLGIAVVLLSTVIRRSAAKTVSTDRWHAFARQPLSTAFVLLLTLLLFSYRAFDLPESLVWLLHLVVLINLLPLARKLLPSSRLRKFFTRIILFLAVMQILNFIHLPSPLFRLFVLFASGFGVVFCFYLYRTVRAQNTILYTTLFQIAAVISLGILLAEFLGYDKYAAFTLKAVLRSLAAFLFYWLLYQMLTGLFERLIQSMHTAFTDRHWKTISRHLAPLLISSVCLLLLVNLIDIWFLPPFKEKSMAGLFQAGFSLFSFQITLGFLLSMALVIYITTLISHWLQVLLLEIIMPKYSADRGVQLSIARIVQYSVFALGCLVMLRVLGVDTSKLALLGGALGVGIGFGLQAIANNFISGLILLFERPIKVGDVILVGQETGEITSLGLRATIVRTYDNAEIVIPNADLITNQVTNWTLEERRIRVKAPVGVAYDSDITKVMEILLRVADEHPLVLSRPKPVVLFLAFGPSSLDFELRAWIPEIDDIMTVRSELNQEIDSEFRSAGISIPFPQSDLHLRSVDPEAARTLCSARENATNPAS